MKFLSNLTLKGKRTFIFIFTGTLAILLVLVAILSSSLSNKYNFKKYSTVSYDDNFSVSVVYYENRHSSYENPSHEIEYSDYSFEVVLTGKKEDNTTFKGQKVNVEMVVKTVEGEYYHLSKSKTSLFSSLNNGKSISLKMENLTKNLHDESYEGTTCDHLDQTPQEIYVNVYYYTIKTVSSKNAEGKTVKESFDVKGNIYYKTEFKDVEKYNVNNCNDKTFNKTSVENTYESAVSNNELYGFKVMYKETSGKTPTADNGVSLDKIEITPVLNKNALGDQIIEDSKIVVVGNIKNEVLDYKNKFADRLVVATYSGNVNENTITVSNKIDELYNIDTLYFFIVVKTNEGTMKYQYKLNLADLK